MDYPKIGCIVMLPCDNGSVGGYVGIECAKGRGKILPGGKWTPEDGTYRNAAAREFREETGLIIDPNDLKYIWHGPDGYGYETFGFLATKYATGKTCDSPEGKVCTVTVEELLQSKYGAWYDVFFSVYWNRMTCQFCPGRIKIQMRYIIRKIKCIFGYHDFCREYIEPPAGNGFYIGCYYKCKGCSKYESCS